MLWGILICNQWILLASINQLESNSWFKFVFFGLEKEEYLG